MRADGLAVPADAREFLDRFRSDLTGARGEPGLAGQTDARLAQRLCGNQEARHRPPVVGDRIATDLTILIKPALRPLGVRQRAFAVAELVVLDHARRSEEHTSELQSLMRISYAVFCLKKK